MICPSRDTAKSRWSQQSKLNKFLIHILLLNICPENYCIFSQFTVIQRYHFCLNLPARSVHLANSLPEWNFRLGCNTLNGKSLMRKANGLNPVLIADYPNLISKSPIITGGSVKEFQMWNLSLAPLAALA